MKVTSCDWNDVTFTQNPQLISIYYAPVITCICLNDYENFGLIMKKVNENFFSPKLTDYFYTLHL